MFTNSNLEVAVNQAETFAERAKTKGLEQTHHFVVELVNEGGYGVLNFKNYCTVKHICEVKLVYSTLSGFHGHYYALYASRYVFPKDEPETL